MTTNNWYKFPHEISAVDEEVNQKLLADFKGERTGFVQVGSKKYFFPRKFAQEAEKYYNIEVREDDVWIATFPRSGTTVTQELVWLIGNDLDYSTAAKIPLEKRFPFLEFGMFFHDEVKQEFLEANFHSELNQSLINDISKHGWELLPTMKSPRFIKTHLPFSLLPKDWHAKRCKTIYVARNPKDVAVSFYHLNRLFKTQGYDGDLGKYWDYFKRGLQPWTPYWSHIEEALEMKTETNILFLYYEDIISDMSNSIRKIASFLEKPLNESQIDELKNHLSFKNFQKNNAVNAHLFSDLKITNSCEQGFIRKGKIDNNNNNNNDECNEELEDDINMWIEENVKKLNISFPKLNGFHKYNLHLSILKQ